MRRPDELDRRPVDDAPTLRRHLDGAPLRIPQIDEHGPVSLADTQEDRVFRPDMLRVRLHDPQRVLEGLAARRRARRHEAAARQPFAEIVGAHAPILDMAANRDRRERLSVG